MKKALFTIFTLSVGIMFIGCGATKVSPPKNKKISIEKKLSKDEANDLLNYTINEKKNEAKKTIGKDFEVYIYGNYSSQVVYRPQVPIVKQYKDTGVTVLTSASSLDKKRRSGLLAYKYFVSNDGRSIHSVNISRCGCNAKGSRCKSMCHNSWWTDTKIGTMANIDNEFRKFILLLNSSINDLYAKELVKYLSSKEHPIRAEHIAEHKMLKKNNKILANEKKKEDLKKEEEFKKQMEAL